jgi:hypothetical protein
MWVRNFRKTPQTHRIEIHTAAGLSAEPPVLEGRLDPESRASFPVLLRAGPNTVAGVQICAFDIMLDDQRYGEWFDCIVEVAR